MSDFTLRVLRGANLEVYRELYIKALRNEPLVFGRNQEQWRDEP